MTVYQSNIRNTSYFHKSEDLLISGKLGEDDDDNNNTNNNINNNNNNNKKGNVSYKTD